jgi:hypothetical protein
LPSATRRSAADGRSRTLDGEAVQRPIRHLHAAPHQLAVDVGQLHIRRHPRGDLLGPRSRSSHACPCPDRRAGRTAATTAPISSSVSWPLAAVTDAARPPRRRRHTGGRSCGPPPPAPPRSAAHARQPGPQHLRTSITRTSRNATRSLHGRREVIASGWQPGPRRTTRGGPMTGNRGGPMKCKNPLKPVPCSCASEHRRRLGLLVDVCGSVPDDRRRELRGAVSRTYPGRRPRCTSPGRGTTSSVCRCPTQRASTSW